MEKDMFWKNVSLLLKNKKISQEKMCEDLGMSIYTLRSSISKQVLPRVDVAKTIADYLDTSVDFLLTGKESNEYKERLENLKTKIENIIQEEGKQKSLLIQASINGKTKSLNLHFPILSCDHQNPKVQD